MIFKAEYLPGASPIEPEELEGLIPATVMNQGQLNVLERQNILAAARWAEQTSRSILSEDYAKRLHTKMFGDVWRWAGAYRRTQRTIGVVPEHVAEQMRSLLKDTEDWIKNQTYTWPQILTLFHYYLVFIQPFPNGNARYARLYTELLARSHGQQVPTWGELKFSGDLDSNSQARNEYLIALKRADDKKIRSLIDFLFS